MDASSLLPMLGLPTFTEKYSNTIKGSIMEEIPWGKHEGKWAPGYFRMVGKKDDEVSVYKKEGTKGAAMFQLYHFQDEQQLECMHVTLHFEKKNPGILIPALPLISCVTLGKSFNLSEPLFSHLYNPDNNNNTKLVTLFLGLNLYKRN